MKNNFWNELQKLIVENREGVIITIIEHNNNSIFKQLEAGDRIVITDEQNFLVSRSEIDFSLEEREQLISKIGDYRKLTGPVLESVSMGAGQAEIYLEKLQQQERLLIFGAGHVAVPLAEIGAMTNFQVEIIDDRPEFNNAGRFPQAHYLYCQDFADFLEDYEPAQEDYLVIVTRGHEYDYDVFKAVIDGNWSYLGMIGSKRKVKVLFDKLVEEKDVDESRLHEVDAPIGLEIGSETPAEIAVSIMAAVIARRRNA